MKFGRSGFARAIDNKTARIALMVAMSCIAIFLSLGGVTQATVPFAPKVSMQVSTTRATAHPDARITIDNSNSDENIKSMTLDLPTGFWGSLAAADKCDYADAQNNACAAGTQIGTVDTSATIDDSDARLRGKVYMTTPAPANVNDDPAGITVIVPAIVGSVNLGDVIVNARVKVRNATLGGSPPTGAVGAVEGVSTIVDSVPQEITDTNSRTVAFHLTKMNIDLTSDLDGPKPPLLTNPSSCSTLAVSGSFTSWDSSNASDTDASPPTVTECTAAAFSPTVDAALTDPTAGGTSGLNAEIDFPENNASVKTIQVKLPPFVGPNFPAFGQTSDQCDAAAAPAPTSPFAPFYCPPQAKVGTVTLTTPLLDGPVVGDVYLINKSPLPWLGVDINPSVSGSNPKGVTIRLVGATNTPQVDSTCDPLFGVFGTCPTQISAVFSNIPDAPATKMVVSLDGPDRTGDSGTLSGKILTTASPNDSVCVPEDEFTATLISNAGNTVKKDAVKTEALAGCNDKDVLIPSGGSSPVGTETTDATPDIDFVGQNGHAAGPFNCFFDSEANLAPCTSPVTPSSNLSNGIHRVFASYSSYPSSRAFVVKGTAPTPDTTAPSTSLTASPTSVATTAPTFNFASNETSDFQCAINPGSSITTAYLPCGSAASSGSFDASGLFAGTEYTFGVRAQDAAGNVDLTPATATFTVDIAFAPTFQADVSTTAARAHPNLDLTITNPSHQDLKDLSFSLPDGFFGGLTGVAALCPLANADAGTCPASSQVGTVDAEAVVDESTIRNSGTVYLTESRDPATEPASLSIKLHPQIQDVEFNDIIVTAHLKIRGVAQGIDTFALDLPNSATNSIDGTTEFDLRKMVVKLRTGAGANYPLLTNPSYCGPMAFTANFTGASGTPAVASQPFQATGCNALGFAPALGISMVDSATGKPAGESDNIKRVALNVSAGLTSDPNSAGISNVRLVMPSPVTIDVQKLPFPCTLEQAAAKACPASTAIGNVSATSPLLPEPLTGTVYILKANPATPSIVLPRLLIALRGRINVDIIATNSFVNVNQIVTSFDTLPDVPLSTFAINITNFLTTRPDACEYGPEEWNVTGTLTGFNGSASNVVIPQTFDCPSAFNTTAFYKFKANRGRSSMSAEVKAEAGKKLQKLTVKLPSGLRFRRSSFTNKRIDRYVKITADGKKVDSKCFTRSNPKRFRVEFCKKDAKKVEITFKTGSIIASKRMIKRPHIRMIAKDSKGKMKRAYRRW